jgi:hypothetical protein
LLLEVEAMKSRLFFAVALLLFLFILVATIDAETVHLKDGRVIKGRIVREDADSITLGQPLGEITFKKADVTKVTKDESELEYERKVKESPPKTSEEHRNVAAWCKEKGLDWLAEEHLKKADELSKTEGQKCESCQGKGKINCSECKGTGKIRSICGLCKGDKFVECPECEGRGKIDNGSGSSNLCPKCEGLKRIKCPNCKGEGSEYSKCVHCNGEGCLSCSACGGKGFISTPGEKEKPGQFEVAPEKDIVLAGKADSLYTEALALANEYQSTESDAKRASLSTKWEGRFSNKVFRVQGNITGIVWERQTGYRGEKSEKIRVNARWALAGRNFEEVFSVEDKSWIKKELGDNVNVLCRFARSLRGASAWEGLFTVLRIEDPKK